MGTDIHLILEVQDQNTNKWYRPEWDKVKSRFFKEPSSLLSDCLRNRNYSLFFALSGVRYWRSESEAPIPLWPDRGLPEDIGDELSAEFFGLSANPYKYPKNYDLGDHNYTYFTAGEWRQAEVQGMLKQIEEVAPDFYWYVTSIFGNVHDSSYSDRWKGIQNMRILVGYDS